MVMDVSQQVHKLEEGDGTSRSLSKVNVRTAGETCSRDMARLLEG